MGCGNPPLDCHLGSGASYLCHFMLMGRAVAHSDDSGMHGGASAIIKMDYTYKFCCQRLLQHAAAHHLAFGKTMPFVQVRGCVRIAY